MCTQIGLDRLKKDNSNLFRYDKELTRVLRKERFKKPKHDVYLNYCIAADKMSFNPYADFDMYLDIETFKLELRGLELICFNYFLHGMIQEEIASMIGKNRSRVSQILKIVFEKFKIFYSEEF